MERGDIVYTAAVIVRTCGWTENTTLGGIALLEHVLSVLLPSQLFHKLMAFLSQKYNQLRVINPHRDRKTAVGMVSFLLYCPGLASCRVAFCVAWDLTVSERLWWESTPHSLVPCLLSPSTFPRSGCLSPQFDPFTLHSPLCFIFQHFNFQH